MPKKALCVGINDFKNYPTAALSGCVNDVKDMEDVLKTFLGFKAEDITILTNEMATKANIMDNLEAMVEGAKAGKYDFLVFSLSSHGTQVPDLSGDEPDRADEAFCPYDLAAKGDRWDPDHIITDDELRDLFAQLPKDVLLEAFLDTCHSGTGTREPTRRPRYMDPPSPKAVKEIEGRRSRGLSRSLMEKGIVRHILWTGCRDDQTSADAVIDGEWHGAFTYYFCKEMRAHQNQLTRKKILNEVRKNLREGDYTQIPQLESEAAARNNAVAVPIT